MQDSPKKHKKIGRRNITRYIIHKPMMSFLRLLIFCWLPATLSALAADAPDGAVQIEADTIAGNDVVRASGDVRACFNNYVLRAETLEYARSAQELRAPHGFELYSTEHLLRGDALRYSPHLQRGEVDNANIAVGKDGLRATGKKLYLQNQLFGATDVELSSCKNQSRDWTLFAAAVQQEPGIVAANNTWLYLGKIPVLYLPTLRIHTNTDKRTGFLTPEFKYNSGEGINYRQPYYFLLAQNYDATLIPHWFSQHGILWGGEFRYLTAAHRGRLKSYWAPEDDRARQQIEHEWRGDSWRIRGFINHVSDHNYFSDFSEDTNLLAMHNLPRGAIAEFEEGGWRARAAFESFKTINYTGTPPHNILPQVQLRYKGGDGDVAWNSDLEYSRFTANRATQIEGQRWLWRGGIWRRIPIGGVVVFPEGGFHAAKYIGGTLSTAAAINADAAFITPYTRLRFESGDRPLPGIAAASYQLRGVYAFAPQTRQQHAPLFDTSLREFSSGGIYDWNRFIGGDRAADTHVAAYGADFRWWDSVSGREFLSMEFAQRYYLRQPRLTLPEESAPPDSGFANLLAAMRAEINGKWRAEGNAEWNPARNDFESVYVDVRADFGGGKLLRAGGLFEKEESVLLGGATPLGDRIEVAFLARYLLDGDRAAESAIATVMRGECDCWRLFFRVANLITAEDNDKKSYSVGFELKGLGRAGGNSYDDIISDLR